MARDLSTSGTPGDSGDLGLDDRYTDPNLIPYETDLATGESADDALEATRQPGDQRFPVEDSSPRPVNWSVHSTEDSTQEAEFEEPYTAPQMLRDNEEADILGAEGPTDSGVDRIVDESYFENEADDLNDDEEAALLRGAANTNDDPDAGVHPDSLAPDISDDDIQPSADDLDRGTASRR